MVNGGMHGGVDPLIGVAQDCGSPAKPVVNKFVAVYIPHFGPFATGHHRRTGGSPIAEVRADTF
ncbi:MAG: hypothetical protein HC875_16070 [Anaerolineales bacterium]|nr:hypothetical protein [Anaerolineales bacterium]